MVASFLPNEPYHVNFEEELLILAISWKITHWNEHPVYTKTSLPYTSLPLHFATVTKIFRLFSPKKIEVSWQFFGKCRIFGKFWDQTSLLELILGHLGYPGYPRKSLEIPEISKLQFFGKSSVLLYYISLLRQSASLPLYFATVRGLTAQKCNGSEVISFEYN